MIRDGRKYNNKLRAAFVINRRIANTVIGRDFIAALDAFPDMPALPTPLMQRVAYVETAAAGLTVIEGAPRSEASREIGQLAEQVICRQGNSPHDEESRCHPRAQMGWHRKLFGCVRGKSGRGSWPFGPVDLLP